MVASMVKWEEQYFTIGINPNQIMNLYNRGPLGGTQYKVNFL